MIVDRRRFTIRLISLDEPIEGKCFLAKNVYSLHKQTILLKEGTELDSYYHNRLLEMGYKHVYVVDEYTEDIQPTELIGPELRAQADAIVFEMLSDTDIVGDKDKIEELRDISREIIAEVFARGNRVTIDLTEIKTFDNYVYLHSVNVAALGVFIGRDIGMGGKELEDYAVGALLHDIGKVQIPMEIIVKNGPLTEEEFKIMQTHTRKGFDLLITNNYLKPRSYAISLNHHESYDGSGYPLGLEGERIHIFSRIAKACDVFDALTSDRPYKNSWSFSKTIHYMSNKIRAKFDSTVLYALFNRVPPYPVGSTVKLSTGEVGLVVENNYFNLSRPRVRIIQDPEGKSLQKGSMNEIKLEENPNIKIV